MSLTCHLVGIDLKHPFSHKVRSGVCEQFRLRSVRICTHVHVYVRNWSISTPLLWWPNFHIHAFRDCNTSSTHKDFCCQTYNSLHSLMALCLLMSRFRALQSWITTWKAGPPYNICQLQQSPHVLFKAMRVIPSLYTRVKNVLLRFQSICMYRCWSYN